MQGNIFGINIEKLDITGAFSKKSALIRLLKDFICYNQGKYIEYEFLIGERHKALKTELSKHDFSIEILRSCWQKLISYIGDQLTVISKANFDRYLVQYYDLTIRSNIPVRICIKGARGDKIVDLLRHEDRRYYTDEHPVKANTGFQYVYDNGTYYLCDDIPKEARRGFYVNPRLRDSCARNYKISWRDRLSRDEIDHNWCNCWEVDSKIPHWQNSCYKSTLIIPMTLINNELGDEFKGGFFIRPPAVNRIIWGFLCFDHPTTRYFAIPDDWRVGYIFADILSLYFISAHIHTTRSKTWLKATEILRKEGLIADAKIQVPQQATKK